MNSLPLRLGLLVCLLALPLASGAGATVNGELRITGELDIHAPTAWVLWNTGELSRSATLHGNGNVVTIRQVVAHGGVGAAGTEPFRFENNDLAELERTPTPVHGEAVLALPPYTRGWIQVGGATHIEGNGSLAISTHNGLAASQAIRYPSFGGKPLLTELPGFWIERQAGLTLHVEPGSTQLVFARGNLTIGDQRFEAGREPLHEAADGSVVWLETLHVLQGTWSLDTYDAPRHVVVPELWGDLAGTLDATSAYVQGTIGSAELDHDTTQTLIEGRLAFQAQYQDEWGLWNVTGTPESIRIDGELLGAWPDLDLATTAAAVLGIGVLAKLVAALVSRQLLADPLTNHTRRLIHDTIHASHGPTAAELLRTIDVGNGTLRYHLYVLQKADLVKARTHRGRVHFHPTDIKANTALQARAHEDAANTAILTYVHAHPDTPQGAILDHLQTHHPLPRTTIQRRLKRLHELGLLTITKNGRTRHYHTTT